MDSKFSTQLQFTCALVSFMQYYWSLMIKKQSISIMCISFVHAYFLCTWYFRLFLHTQGGWTRFYSFPILNTTYINWPSLLLYDALILLFIATTLPPWCFQHRYKFFFELVLFWSSSTSATGANRLFGLILLDLWKSTGLGSRWQRRCSDHILRCSTMTFDPLPTVQFHPLLGSKTRSAMRQELPSKNHFKFLWNSRGTWKPAWRANFEWNWTVASGSHTYREVCSDAFEKLNQLGRSEASTKAPAAEVKLDQNKMSSQKNCTGL